MTVPGWRMEDGPLLPCLKLSSMRLCYRVWFCSAADDDALLCAQSHFCCDTHLLGPDLVCPGKAQSTHIFKTRGISWYSLQSALQKQYKSRSAPFFFFFKDLTDPVPHISSNASKHSVPLKIALQWSENMQPVNPIHPALVGSPSRLDVLCGWNHWRIRGVWCVEGVWLCSCNSTEEAGLDFKASTSSMEGYSSLGIPSSPLHHPLPLAS